MDNQQTDNSTKLMRGIKFAFLTAAISGTANFVNKSVITSGIDPIALSIVKNGLVGLAFIGLFWFLLKELKDYSLKKWLKLFLVAIIGGCIPFILFFKGMASSSAVASCFLHKTIFFWVAILAVIFLKEKLNKYQFIALAIMLAGFLPIIEFNFFNFGRGELLILAATLLWSAEVILVKKFIQDIDYRILAASRMALGTIFISFYALATGSFSSVFQLAMTDMFKILIVSALLFGFVFTWYRALTLAPANVVTSVLTLALPMTMLLSSIQATTLPSIFNFLTIIFITIGTCLYLVNIRFANYERA